VELPRLLHDQVQDFLCFYLIFGCRAFERDPAKEARERLDTRLVETIVDSPFETPGGRVDTVFGYAHKPESAPTMAMSGVVVADAKIVIDAQLQTKAVLFINFANAKRRGPLKGSEFMRQSDRKLLDTLRKHPAFIHAGRRKRFGGVHVRWTMLDWEMIRHMSA